MNIAVFHNLPSGGALRTLYQKVRLFEERGWAVSLYTLETSDRDFLPPPVVRDQSRVEPLAFKGPFRFARYRDASRRLADRINRSDADWVYVDKCRFFGSPPILKNIRKPTVYYCHEPLGLREYAALAGGTPEAGNTVGGALSRLSFFEGFEKLWNFAGRALIKEEDRRSIRAATAVLAPSRFAAAWIERVYGVRPTVVYQGVDVDFFTPGSPRKKDDIVLSVGRVGWHKNHGFAVRAVAALPKEERPRLAVVCDDIERREKARLETEASRFGVSLEIRLRIGEEELRALYRAARAVLCAAFHEPFGLVPLEAMACGAPVLAARDGGYLETVIDGRTGFILDRDPALWAEKIRDLADPEYALRIGSAGRAHAVKHWTWAPFVDSLEKNVLVNLKCRMQPNLLAYPTSASSS